MIKIIRTKTLENLEADKISFSMSFKSALEQNCKLLEKIEVLNRQVEYLKDNLRAQAEESNALRGSNISLIQVNAGLKAEVKKQAGVNCYEKGDFCKFVKCENYINMIAGRDAFCRHCPAYRLDMFIDKNKAIKRKGEPDKLP